VSEVDVDQLPPTQYLILEVLAARARCGDDLWPFPTRLSASLRALEDAGLIAVMHGNVEKTRRAFLTEAGKAAALLDGYVPPVRRRAFEEAVDAIPAEDDAIRAWLTERHLTGSAGAGAVLSAVRMELLRMAEGQRKVPPEPP
jgi:hypothetical protein